MEHAESDSPIVLVIDDSEDIHRLLEARLRSERLRVVGSTNGVDGAKIAVDAQPALIMLDLDMPVMDGFETLRTLKENPATSSIPVIMLSGTDQTQAKVTGLDLGAIDYITKPFNFAELRARVRAALRLKRLMDLLAQRAQIDGLTGLWNRDYFNSRLEEEISHCERSGDPLALSLCDVDHFKKLNDTHGHPAGDNVLEEFAVLLRRASRTSDICCRYGGEEFAVIMRDTHAPEGAKLLERIRAELEATRWPRHPEHGVTCSFGVCDRSGAEDMTVDAWVKAADEALYTAKRTGRNRVVVAPVIGMKKAS